MASIFFLRWDLFRGILRSECGHILCRSLKRFSVHYAMHVFVFDGNWRSCVFYSLRRLYCPCIIFQTVTQPWMVNLHFLPLSSALLRSHTESDTGGTEAECLHNLVAANMQYFIKTVFYYCLMLHPFRGVHCVQETGGINCEFMVQFSTINKKWAQRGMTALKKVGFGISFCKVRWLVFAKITWIMWSPSKLGNHKNVWYRWIKKMRIKLYFYLDNREIW